VWDYLVVLPNRNRRPNAANLVKRHHHLSLNRRRPHEISASPERHANREMRVNKGDHVSPKKHATNAVNRAMPSNNHLKTLLAVHLRYRKTRLRPLFVESCHNLMLQKLKVALPKLTQLRSRF
jgi:hypothetical protein